MLTKPQRLVAPVSRAGTAGLLALAALDLAGVLVLAGTWLVVAAACAVLWVAPPVLVVAAARRGRRRGRAASWRSLEPRLAVERDAPRDELADAG